jgi:hypothetical protein
MTKKKPRPAVQRVSEKQALREQLQDACAEIRALQMALSEIRKSQQGDTCAQQASPKPKAAPVTLTHVADDLANAVDALQSSVARLEERMIPLLPDELVPTYDVTVLEVTDAPLSSQLLLSVNQIRLVTGLVDALTNAMQI